MTKRWRRTNFQFWAPSGWNQIAGNRRLKELLRNLVRMYRLTNPNTWKLVRLLVTGDSRTGKTMLLKFFVKCLMCKSLDPEALNPCGACTHCTCDVNLLGMVGLFSDIEEATAGTYEGEKVAFHYVPLDCTALDPKTLEEQLTRLQEYDGLRIVNVDEAHRLVKRNCDDRLLKPVEEKDFLWLFSTAYPKPLEEMFTNRLLKEGTQLPANNEAEDWTVDRLQEERIPYDAEAVVRLVDKCECVLGQVLLALTRAAIEPEGLTRKLVDDFKPKLDE